MTTSHAHVRTENSGRYILEISRAWLTSAISLVWDCSHAAIVLPYGHCELNAGHGFLDIRLAADSVSSIVSLENIISDQLDHVSRGEHLRYQWILESARETTDLPASVASNFSLESPRHDVPQCVRPSTLQTIMKAIRT
jgi:hypothetical protein